MNKIIAEERTNIEKVYLDLKSEETINIEVKSNASLLFSTLASKNLNNTTINVDVYKDASFVGYLADFSNGEEKVKVIINLKESGARCEWHLASLSSKEDRKEFDVSFYHLAPNTFAKMDNYGVCKDEAKLVFSGIGSIVKGSYASKTHQNAKIMIFDESCDAVAKPILKIDENDIEASHAAVVGKINDEHLFYLKSRGLTENIAKELITYGYLKPITNGFNDESVKEDILKLIQEKI